MNPILQVLVSVIGTLSAYGLFLVAQYVYWQLTSPLQTLPGPPNSSFMYGNSREIQDAVRIFSKLRCEMLNNIA